MRPFALLVACLAFVSIGLASNGRRTIAAHGVRVVAPAGWKRVRATPSGVVDPRTLLVVGTSGVAPNVMSQCQIAAYRLGVRGAVVVVVGWRTASSGGGHQRPGRAPLKKLVAVTRPSFECFSGRGASAQVVLGGRVYQVNVLVGDRAPKQRIADALAVARSLDLTR
jgi:hypothetical protein